MEKRGVLKWKRWRRRSKIGRLRNINYTFQMEYIDIKILKILNQTIDGDIKFTRRCIITIE